MKLNDFFIELAEALEMEDVHLKKETDFRELENFDSLSVISIVAFLDKKFGIRLPVEKLRIIVTVNDLIEAIGLDHFESNR